MTARSAVSERHSAFLLPVCGEKVSRCGTDEGPLWVKRLATDSFVDLRAPRSTKGDRRRTEHWITGLRAHRLTGSPAYWPTWRRSRGRETGWNAPGRENRTRHASNIRRALDREMLSKATAWESHPRKNIQPTPP